MYWAIANWFGVVAEQQFYRLSKTKFFTNPRHRIVKDRCYLLIQALLFGWLINSNLIYLFQIDPSYQIIKRLYTENLGFTLYAHFALYCGVIAINVDFTKRLFIEEKIE